MPSKKTPVRRIRFDVPGHSIWFDLRGQEVVEYQRLCAAKKLRYAQVRGNKKAHKFALAVARREQG